LQILCFSVGVLCCQNTTTPFIFMEEIVGDLI
jgi:hypothetical protein